MDANLEERKEQVDEVRSGHELYKDEVSLTVTFDRLNEPQAIALIAMFESWERHGRWGSSRLSKFYVDGDGPFHPEISFETNEDIVLTNELKEEAEVNEDSFDFDPVVGKFIDYALEMEE